jgi:hypothetical protein
MWGKNWRDEIGRFSAVPDILVLATPKSLAGDVVEG